MFYSEQVSEILENSSKIAREMNSSMINSSHIIKAALRCENIRDCIIQSDIDIASLDNDIDEECENCAKLSKNRIERYKRANVERRMQLDMTCQQILSVADSLAETTSLRGEIGVSHLITAFLNVQDSSPSLINHICNDGKKDMMITAEKLVCLLASYNDTMPIGQDEMLDEDENEEETFFSQNPFSGSSSFRRPEKKEDVMKKFCCDLIKAAKTDDKPFIGRSSELASLMQCLERRDKPNAILVGSPGVGKTDVVRGLALKIAKNDVPEQLKDVNLFSVDIAGMLAGSEYRGSFEKRLKAVIETACKITRPILFIDEIHTVLGAGRGSDSSMDAANILKPYLTTGKIRVIGATTDNEYRQYVEKDAAFMRRFQKVDISEPTPNETIDIICGVRPAYEKFHNVSIQKEAIKSAVNLSVRHMHDRFLPDKAIDIIDQTCARIKLDGQKKITAIDVEKTVSTLCHVPMDSIQKDDMDKVRVLDKKIKNKVFGQDEAIDKITEAIQISKSGLGDETKPIGSFLFVGPSGVGKTEIAKQLAANLGINFIRFDMSEYAESHSVAKLIGSPAGYVGYDDGGILVEEIRKNPNAVVLFDEIEKAHPDIYKIFLQIFDYGMLTDNKGRKADFRNTIIIMTSNAGNSAVEKRKLGFGEKTVADKKETSMKAVSELMAPELRGRITSTVVFNSLNNEVARLIVKKELSTLTSKLRLKKIAVTYTDKAIDEIANRGISAQYGAREIQRVIDKDIKTLFVKLIISGKVESKYTVDYLEGKFIVKAN